MSNVSPSEKFKQALTIEKPLQIVGTINAYSALMAQEIGFKAIYLSGGGVAAASYGVPDLGITSLNDVLEDARRITAVCPLPLLVDIDTGFGGAFNIERTIKAMINAGVAAVHIEDQVQQKRCGHRPGKAIVSIEEMVDRIKAAVYAKTDTNFIVIARTDALAVEGFDSALARAQAYIDAGADMIFPEAFTELEQYHRLISKINVPVLANITEFGKTPLFTATELASVGVSMVLYPLSAFRAMSKAAENVYSTIRQEGTQQSTLNDMQTREELYRYLHYHQYEQKLDELFSKEEK